MTAIPPFIFDASGPAAAIIIAPTALRIVILNSTLVFLYLAV
jgi:hypothetical protein